MRMFRQTSALVIALISAAPVAAAAPKAKSSAAAEGSKKAGKEISTDDRALDKQMDWEAKVMGSNTVKKIDMAKIQKLQAEELARREKQEKIDQVEKDRKEREAAAAAAAQRNVRAPSTRDMPAVTESPPAPRPAEKHDDAFVDKLLTGKGEKKKAAVSNDDVDQLLNKVKQEKAPPAAGRHGKGADNVDQLLATADKQAAIKTTARRPAEVTEVVSAEAAAREATLKAIAAAAAKSQEERARNKRPAVPDAAMLRAQQASTTRPQSERAKPAPARAAAWTDPFAADRPSGSSSRGRGETTPTTTVPASSRGGSTAAGRHAPPASRPAGNRNDSWQDPFDSGGRGSTKPRTGPGKAAPAARPSKRSANWKDPFA
ncbi:MAG: hypothetical protein ABI560_08925 [Myxococcales bacterium]